MKLENNQNKHQFLVQQNYNRIFITWLITFITFGVLMIVNYYFVIFTENFFYKFRNGTASNSKEYDYYLTTKSLISIISNIIYSSFNVILLFSFLLIVLTYLNGHIFSELGNFRLQMKELTQIIVFIVVWSFLLFLFNVVSSGTYGRTILPISILLFFDLLISLYMLKNINPKLKTLSKLMKYFSYFICSGIIIIMFANSFIIPFQWRIGVIIDVPFGLLFIILSLFLLIIFKLSWNNNELTW